MFSFLNFLNKTVYKNNNQDILEEETLPEKLVNKVEDNLNPPQKTLTENYSSLIRSSLVDIKIQEVFNTKISELDLLYFSIFEALLMKHLAEVKDAHTESEVLSLAQAFFARNWNIIKSTNLAYPHQPNALNTRICYELANFLSSHLKIHPFLLLMPTLNNTEMLNGNKIEDEKDLQLWQFILNDQNNEIILVEDCLIDAEEDGLLKAQHLTDGKIRLLAQDEKNRIIHHSSLTQKHYNYFEKLQILKKDNRSIWNTLLDLKDGLLNGSVRGTDNATEFNAGRNANTAIVKFFQIYDVLPGYIKKVLEPLRARLSYETLGILLQRLRNPAGTNLRAHNANNLGARYCVQLISGSLDRIMKENEYIIRRMDSLGATHRLEVETKYVLAKSSMQANIKTKEYPVRLHPYGLSGTKMLTINLAYEALETLNPNQFTSNNFASLDLIIQGMEYNLRTRDNIDYSFKNVNKFLCMIPPQVLLDYCNYASETRILFLTIFKIGFYYPYLSEKFNKLITTQYRNYPNDSTARKLLYFFDMDDSKNLLALLTQSDQASVKHFLQSEIILPGQPSGACVAQLIMIGDDAGSLSLMTTICNNFFTLAQEFKLIPTPKTILSTSNADNIIATLNPDVINIMLTKIHDHEIGLYSAAKRFDSSLFIKFIEKASSQTIIALFYTSKNLARELINNHSTAYGIILLKLLQDRQGDKFLLSLVKDSKKFLRETIKQLPPGEFKNKFLKSALDKTTSLGEFFYLQRGFFKPSVARGNLKQLQKILDAEVARPRLVS